MVRKVLFALLALGPLVVLLDRAGVGDIELFVLAALALIPLAVRLPLPEKLPAWIQAIVASLYALVPAAGALALAWQSSRTA